MSEQHEQATSPDGPPPEPVDAAAPHVPEDASSGPEVPAEATELSVEALVADLERVTGERDAAIEARMRLQADFENFRKRVAKQQTEQAERASEALVAQLLPVLDALDSALAHGTEGVEPIHASLLEVLGREGLVRIAEPGASFDPNVHEAVMHEAGDDGAEPVVDDVLRTGYVWKSRVVRPAMVKVRG
ncbi:MAG: nucleotide exchange factor GrpE [Actinomycetota bacterium]|nr:nucleotide exchange factor GrpE [Actinomycetota bacterium]